MTAILFVHATGDAEAWRAALASHLPDVAFRVWPDCRDPDEVTFALVWEPPAGFHEPFKNLRTVMSVGAGVDHLLRLRDLPERLVLARVVDPFLTRMMCEYVLFATLRYHRLFDVFEQAQSSAEWLSRRVKPAADRTVGVMGLGRIGTAVAQLLVKHGFRVRGWSRSPKSLAGVEDFCGDSELHAFLSETEILICLLPLTDRTRGILDRSNLGRLPKGACLVNVGRGAQLVDEALLELLDTGHLRGATLDVFGEEPLPAAHRFWSHPRVLVTPHIAAYTDPRSAAAQVAENVRRTLTGAPLINPVDRAAHRFDD